MPVPSTTMRVGTTTMVLLCAAVLLLGCDAGEGNLAEASTSSNAPIVAPEPVAVSELVPGDCITGLVLGAAERRRLESVQVVSCQRPHELEVFASFELDPASFEVEDQEYPGEERVVRAADEGCERRLEQLVEADTGGPAERVDDAFGLISVWPTPVSWSQGDRTVACAAFLADGRPFERPGILAGG